MIFKRGFAIGLIALLLAPSMAFAQQSVNVEGLTSPAPSNTATRNGPRVVSAP